MINRDGLISSRLGYHRFFPLAITSAFGSRSAVGAIAPPCFNITFVAVLRANVLGL